MAFLWILLIVAVVAFVWFFVVPTLGEQWDGEEITPRQPVEVPGLSFSGIQARNGALIPQKRVVQLGNFQQAWIKSTGVPSGDRFPRFVHTLNSSVSCTWLITFIEAAGKGGLFELESVRQAIGTPTTSPPWDYATKVLEATTPATSVVVPLLTTGTLATGALLAAPAAAAAGFIALLVGLDSDIKQRIAEAEACKAFVTEFCKSYSLPPMGLLNALSNLVDDSRSYGMYEGSGSAFDRSQEWGVGFVGEMQKLFVALKERGLLAGMGIIGNPGELKRLIRKREIKVPLNNNIDQLDVSRLAPVWIRYALSVDSLFGQPWFLGWKREPDFIYKEVLKENFRATNNPFSFTRNMMVQWMQRGGQYNGLYNGYINPAFMLFKLGHDPSLNDYRFDTGFLSIGAGGTKARVGETSWVSKLEVDTNGGWVYVQ